jgi:hypothetical protein
LDEWPALTGSNDATRLPLSAAACDVGCLFVHLRASHQIDGLFAELRMSHDAGTPVVGIDHAEQLDGLLAGTSSFYL